MVQELPQIVQIVLYLILQMVSTAKLGYVKKAEDAINF
jgi:hypothetical protein